MGMEGYVWGSTKQREQLVEWMVPEFSSPSAGLRRWGWRGLNCIFSLVPSNLALHSSLLCSVPQEQPLGCTNGLPDFLASVLGWGKRKEPGNIFPGFPLFQAAGAATIPYSQDVQSYSLFLCLWAQGWLWLLTLDIVRAGGFIIACWFPLTLLYS